MKLNLRNKFHDLVDFIEESNRFIFSFVFLIEIGVLLCVFILYINNPSYFVLMGDLRYISESYDYKLGECYNDPERFVCYDYSHRLASVLRDRGYEDTYVAIGKVNNSDEYHAWTVVPIFIEAQNGAIVSYKDYNKYEITNTELDSEKYVRYIILKQGCNNYKDLNT